MEPVHGFEGAFMMDDNLLFHFPAEGESSNLNHSVFGSPSAGKTTAFGPGTHNYSLPDPALEDLNWLMDQEPFPPLDSCFELLSDDSEFMPTHQSPTSVLDSGQTNGDIHNNHLSVLIHPKGIRSNNRRRRAAGYGDLPSRHCLWSNLPSAPISQESAIPGRRCQHCLVDKTPQWRAGPTGPKTLCNACGVRYKAGRLHPEYRPACSPTFSSLLHSNSHKKVMEMRMKNQD